MGTPGILRFEDEHGGTHEFPAIYRSQWEQWMKEKGTQYAELPEGVEVGEIDAPWSAPPKPSDAFNDTQFGVMEEDPEAAGGAYNLPRPGTDQPDAGVPPLVDPIEAAGEKEWGDSVARRARAQEAIPHDARATGPEYDAPLKQERYSGGESFTRGYLDQAGLGLDDSGAGLGGMFDERTRENGQATSGWVDSVLRGDPWWSPFNADIPMRVDRTVRSEGRNLKRDADGELIRFQDGTPMREQGELETKSQMAYEWPPKIDNYDPARINATQSEEPVTKHMRDVAPRLEGREFGAEPQGRVADYHDAYSDSRKSYVKNNRAAFDEDPFTFAAGSALAAFPQSALTRRIFPGATSAREADAAVRRAGPGVGKFIERVAAGATDAVKNRGNQAAAAISGAGHAEGDDLQQWLTSAVGNAATEMGTQALGSLFAEMILNPVRSAGRGILKRLEDSWHNPDHAQTIVTARNAGMEPEAFEKPEGPGLFAGNPTTSEMGVRPGEKMRTVQRNLLKGTPLDPEPRTPAPMPGDKTPGERAVPSVAGWSPSKVGAEDPLPPGWRPPPLEDQVSGWKPLYPKRPKQQLELDSVDRGPDPATPLSLEPSTPAPALDDAASKQLHLAEADRGPPATRSRRSALVGEELRKKSADNLTMAAEEQRKAVEKWINEEKAKLFESPEGQKVIAERELRGQLEQINPSPDFRAKTWAFIQDNLKTFGGERNNRWTMPSHGDVPGEPPPLPNSAMPEGKRGKYRGLQARDLDEMIKKAADKAKSHKGLSTHDVEAEWDSIHQDLIEFRKKHYKTLEKIAQQGHERLNKREANATVLGIPREASPIQTAHNSPHAQAIMQRLGQFKDNPQIQEAVTNLEQHGASPELSEQAAGALATQELISDAQKGGAGWNARLGPLSVNLGKYNPGMRPAGLANLGLNSNAALRGASAEWIQWMGHLLGIEPAGSGPGNLSDNRHPLRRAKP